MVCTANAKTDIRDEVKNYLKNKYTYFGIGSGTTADSESDTALENELVRKEVTETVLTTTSVIFRCYIATTELNGNTLSEIGLFDSSSGGLMLYRKMFGGITKTSDIDLWLEIEIEVSVA